MNELRLKIAKKLGELKNQNKKNKKSLNFFKIFFVKKYDNYRYFFRF